MADKDEEKKAKKASTSAKAKADKPAKAAAKKAPAKKPAAKKTESKPAAKKTEAPNKEAAKKADAPKKAAETPKAVEKKTEAKPAAKKASAPKKTSARKPKKKPTGKTVTVTQIGSPIGRQGYQQKILIGLGLNKMHRTRTLEDTPSVRGMINKISHLVKVTDEAA